MIITGFLLSFLGTGAFLLLGILLSFVLFPKSDAVERSAFSLALSIGFFGMLSTLLYFAEALNQFYFWTLTVLSVCLLLAIIADKSKNRDYYETKYDKSIFFVLFFSLFGTLWRYFCLKYFELSSFAVSDTYSYSFKFMGQKIPDLGFYTGMAQDKSKYIGSLITDNVLTYLHINSTVIMFFAVFLCLSLVFLVFKGFRIDARLAYLGVAIMSIGPIELFYAQNNIYGHPLSYVVLLPLFLIFITKKENLFWIVLLFSVTMMETYYTSSMIIILSSLGFIVAIAIKEFLKAQKVKEFAVNFFKNKKVLHFFIIFLVIFSYFILFSKMSAYSVGRLGDKSDLEISAQQLSLNKTAGQNETTLDTIYKDPAFLSLSAIRWQMLFFFLCGMTFIFHLAKLTMKKKVWQQEEIDLFLCLIPVVLISCGFLYVNLPARIFDYFSFFGLMTLTLPQKYFKAVFVACLCFILITGACVVKDKKVFFEVSKGEYSAAKELKTNISGKIFSDEVFVNQLVLNGYYNVTGADDKDRLVRDLFYQNDKRIFLDSINYLKESGVDYIAVTKRMREKYVLMVNYPQKPIFNFDFYEQFLKKAYSNGDVSLYSTNLPKNLK